MLEEAKLLARNVSLSIIQMIKPSLAIFFNCPFSMEKYVSQPDEIDQKYG